MPANSPIIKGLSTIKWSTGSTLGTPAAALVEGVRISENNVDVLRAAVEGQVAQNAAANQALARLLAAAAAAK